MGWVNDARKELAAGRQVQVRPFGGSMRGRIESGQLVTLAPVDPTTVGVDDVVLVEWRGNFVLHLVKEVRNDQLLIGQQRRQDQRLGAGLCRGGQGYRGWGCRFDLSHRVFLSRLGYCE